MIHAHKDIDQTSQKMIQNDFFSDVSDEQNLAYCVNKIQIMTK